ncbi:MULTISPECIES: hypothetical protein [Dolichospermum]|uniref:Uncharacterized protein n=1 Tax=Dolichospermum flos-aquae CCAP 1403/13F TaxID=315271 RepID=A0A6H2BUJ2_DOLFA|nr:MULTISPECIES: hypothetical protein [Dolichospermum]MTJ22325.1 hypothetical protein [Dolichospermum sp. UHCC 0352]QJB42897.1 hypothetical protein HGD76_00150 [Dolichospermum flos-aquae CCAP 1403/13F]
MNLKEDFWKKAMSKIIYDVIQRFEVENGVPRLVSTNIQVIEGGEDLLSLATSILAKLGFYEKFDENRTSQYIGYRLKNPGKGAKRYQLVLAQRKEGLCISIPKDVLTANILHLTYFTDDEFTYGLLANLWILPSQEDRFYELMQTHYPNLLELGEITGFIPLNRRDFRIYNRDPGEDINLNNCHNYINSPEEFDIDKWGNNSCYMVIDLLEDKLFPYTYQVCISSGEVLEEFITYFAKILMEKN